MDPQHGSDVNTFLRINNNVWANTVKTLCPFKKERKNKKKQQQQKRRFKKEYIKSQISQISTIISDYINEGLYTLAVWSLLFVN